MFAREALKAVRVMKRLDFSLRFIRSFAVHIALLFEVAYFPSSLGELYQTLITDEEKNGSEGEDRNNVLAPFTNFNERPKFRE
jgi:hypothetical protein